MSFGAVLESLNRQVVDSEEPDTVVDDPLRRVDGEGHEIFSKGDLLLAPQSGVSSAQEESLDAGFESEIFQVERCDRVDVFQGH